MTDKAGGTDARLAALTQREHFIRENWLRRILVPPAWLLDEVRELADARIQLEEEKATSASELDLARVADELLALLQSGRIAEFMSETPEH